MLVQIASSVMVFVMAGRRVSQSSRDVRESLWEYSCWICVKRCVVVVCASGFVCDPEYVPM